MLRGFYTAASGMMANQRSTETISNNISNINTPGYKTDESSLRAFPELLLQKMGQKHTPNTGMNRTYQQPLGNLSTGVYTQENIADFSQGEMKETGMETDMAIINGEMPDEDGAIFFTVENEDGEERFTRNGHFTVDGEGYLTANNGSYILDENNNRIQTNGLAFDIDTNGAVQIGEEEILLNMSYVENVNDLTKDTDDMYELEESTALNAADAEAAFTIEQGKLEGSTVDGEKAMTAMLEAYRSFELNQKVMKTYDESMSKTVNEVGSLT